MFSTGLVFAAHGIRVQLPDKPSEAQRLHRLRAPLGYDTLRDRVTRLRASFELVTCAELSARLARHRGGGERPFAALTFDDGDSTLRTHVAPLLKELGVPATAFVVTSSLENGEMLWPQKLELLLRLVSTRYSDHERELLEAEIAREDGLPSTFDLPAILGRRLKSIAPKDIECVLQDYAARMRIAWPLLAERGLMLTWEDLLELKRDGWEIGSHTVYHSHFSRISVQEMDEELRCSRARLESALSAPVVGFCLPFGGRTDVNACPPAQVAGAGYAYCCTSMHGTNRPGCSSYALRRTQLRDEGTLRFGLRTLGILDLIARVRDDLGN
jgi:peptidoglycan/xylan/chitin deacetylase (PgdA/CDA1 family)